MTLADMIGHYSNKFTPPFARLSTPGDEYLEYCNSLDVNYCKIDRMVMFRPSDGEGEIADMGCWHKF
jgi:hypothetical protein